MVIRKSMSLIWGIFFAGSVASAATVPVLAEPDVDSEGCYLISNAAELFGFAAIVNGSDGNAKKQDACGKLTDNIVVNTGVLDENGVPNEGEFVEWTPVMDFSGTFDGQGFYISGLFFNDPNRDKVGLFGCVVNSENHAVLIHNVGVEKSYLHGHDYVGSLVGHADLSVDIQNSYNTSTVVGNGFVGGLIGFANASVNIRNSYNIGRVESISSNGWVAGIVAQAGYGTSTLVNSYNAGSVVGSRKDDLVYGGSTSITNSFYLGVSYKNGFKATAEQFADGSVAMALHNFREDGFDGSIWGQVVGRHSEPVFSGDVVGASANTYQVILHTFTGDVSEYSSQYVENLKFSLPLKPYREGYVFKGWYDNPSFSGEAITTISAGSTGDKEFWARWNRYVTPVMPSQNIDGCYLISNEQELFGYAAVVNGSMEGVEQNTGACGLLTDNIVVNENVLAAMDHMDRTDFAEWTPMVDFAGAFDGQGHYISGLYFNDSSRGEVGLFGSVNALKDVEVAIRNVGILDSYLRGGDCVGGLIGAAITPVKIVNSFNASYIEADIDYGWAGGLVALGYDESLIIENSFNVGTIVGAETDDFVLWGTPTILNSFYSGFSDKGGMQASADEFADGTVASSLHDYVYSGTRGTVWGQNVGVDPYPDFSGAVGVRYGAVTISMDNSTITIDGESSLSVDFDEPIIADNVILNRSFVANTVATLVLPFDMPAGSSVNATFYTPTIEWDEGRWIVLLDAISSDNVKANTPYVIIPKSRQLKFNLSESVTLRTGSASTTSDNGWTFVGMYDYKKWEKSELGKIYCFAGRSTSNVVVGQFVRAAYGAYINPMRVYLVRNGTPKNAPSIYRAKSFTDENVETIEVRIREKDDFEAVAGVKRNRITEHRESPKRWIDLKGRRLKSEPMSKGVYIGNKNVVKRK